MCADRVGAPGSSVVQFQYGEDGIDVQNASFLKQFPFLARNADRLQEQQLPAAGGKAPPQLPAAQGMLEEQAAQACR